MLSLLGFDNYYIDEEGRIYNSKRDRYLKPYCDNLGYLQVALSKEGKLHYFRVHRLVALSFLEPIAGKTYVNHKNGNKKDNRVENLEWCNNSENMKHAYATGCYNAKHKCAVDVFAKHNNQYLYTAESVTDLAKITGHNRKTLTAILKGEKKNNFNYIFRYKQESATTNEITA